MLSRNAIHCFKTTNIFKRHRVLRERWGRQCDAASLWQQFECGNSDIITFAFAFWHTLCNLVCLNHAEPFRCTSGCEMYSCFMTCLGNQRTTAFTDTFTCVIVSLLTVLCCFDHILDRMFTWNVEEPSFSSPSLHVYNDLGLWWSASVKHLFDSSAFKQLYATVTLVLVSWLRSDFWNILFNWLLGHGFNYYFFILPLILMKD